jgi:hypothetical protein
MYIDRNRQTQADTFHLFSAVAEQIAQVLLISLVTCSYTTVDAFWRMDL